MCNKIVNIECPSDNEMILAESGRRGILTVNIVQAYKHSLVGSLEGLETFLGKITHSGIQAEAPCCTK
jgi:hypothetical protein